MSDYNELVTLLQELLLNKFSPKPSFTRGILGDGQGNVTVQERPDKSYVRFNRGAGEFFEVFNRTVNPVEGWPVLIGELPWQPGLTQVVDTDWAAFEQSGWGDNIGATSPHAPTHEWPDGSPGSDPVNIYTRSIVPLRSYVDSTGTNVFVNSYEYEYEGSGHIWGGTPGIDLSPVISSMSSGTMRFMGVYLDPDTNLLNTITGSTTVFTSAFDPPRVQFPANVLPSARVRVYGSQANLQDADIKDARQPFSVANWWTAGGDLTGSYPNPQVSGLFGYPLEGSAPSEGDLWVFSGSAWRHIPAGDLGGGGNVWPKAGEAGISDTQYGDIDNFFDALANGDQGIIGEGSFTTDWTGGHATIPTGADVKGSGVDVTLLTSADSYTLESEGQSLIEQMTIQCTKSVGPTAFYASDGADDRLDTVKAIATASSDAAIGFNIINADAVLVNCESYASGGAVNYAVYVFDDDTGASAELRKGYYSGDVVADGSGATIHLDGPIITGSVTESNGGTITGHYYDSSDILHRANDQSTVYAYDSVTNTNNIYRGNAISNSDFVATIATLPGGAVLTYNAPSSGDEANLVPVSTGQLAKMVLHNTSAIGRGDPVTDALISNCNTGTNTITLTANVPGTWVADPGGDTITIRSQTNTTAPSAGVYFMDFEFTSGVTADSVNVIGRGSIVDSGAASNYYLIFHPYEANSGSKWWFTRTQVAAISLDFTVVLTVDTTARRFCLAWRASGSNTLSMLFRMFNEGNNIR